MELEMDGVIYDFVENREDLGHIIEKIDAEFNSLFGRQGTETERR